MKNIKNLFSLNSVKIIILALILSVGVSYLYAWTNPQGTPPDINTPAPLNVGSLSQTKTGDLTVNGLTATNVSAGVLTVSSKLVIPVLSTDPTSPVTGQMWLKN